MSSPGHCTVESHKICSAVVKSLKEQPQMCEMHALKQHGMIGHAQVSDQCVTTREKGLGYTGIFFTLSNIQMSACRYKEKRFIIE